MNSFSLQLGIAKVDITPPVPVPLSGYLTRTKEYERVVSPLFVRAWLFVQRDETGVERKALLVQADLIWWGNERLSGLYQKIKQKWDIEATNVLFHASHTHGGPHTTGDFAFLTDMQTAYIDYLEHKVEDAIAKAHEDMEVVRIERGTGECSGISINRRKRVGDSVEMRPNPDGVNDREVTVFRFITNAEQTKGVLFHFTCHPTTMSDTNALHSDYCGVAMKVLDDKFGDGVSCFLQGCCGDIRPAVHTDGEFYPGSFDDVDKNGKILAGTVLEILDGPMTPVPPACIIGSKKVVELPFERVPTTDELEPESTDTEIHALWKKLMLKPNRLVPTIPLRMQLLQIANGLSFLAMSGEIVVEYGLLIKNISEKTVLPLGYSNGMIGYVPTAAQLREGGYEPKGSVPFFGLPSPFSARVEEIMQDGIRELILQSV